MCVSSRARCVDIVSYVASTWFHVHHDSLVSNGTFHSSLIGPQSSNIDPQWRKLLDTVGVTDAQLEDKNTANFIYDFVEKHGGIQEANRQLEAASKKGGPPPPPSRHGPPPPARGGPSVGRRGLPPPPPRDSGHSGGKGNIPAPPPPPPVGKRGFSFESSCTGLLSTVSPGVPQPPPPPPLSSSGPPPPPPPSGGPPPPPAKSSSPTSSLPPVSDGRSNLMASIRAGIQLRTVSSFHASDFRLSCCFCVMISFLLNVAKQLVDIVCCR